MSAAASSSPISTPADPVVKEIPNHLAAAGSNDQRLEAAQREFGPQLLAFARSILREDRERGHDVVQDVFLKLHKHGADKIEPGRMKAWLFAVCRNRAIDILRKEKPMTVTDATELASVRDQRPDPSIEAERREQQGQVLELLGAVAAGMAAMLTVTTLVHFKSNEAAEMSILSDQVAPMVESNELLEVTKKRSNEIGDVSVLAGVEPELPELAAVSDGLEVQLSKAKEIVPMDRTESLEEQLLSGVSRSQSAPSTASAPISSAKPAAKGERFKFGLTGSDAASDSGSTSMGSGGVVVADELGTEYLLSADPVGSTQPKSAPVGLVVPTARARGQITVPSTGAMPEKAAESFRYAAGSKVVTSKTRGNDQAMSLAEIDEKIMKIDTVFREISASPGGDDRILKERRHLQEQRAGILARTQGGSSDNRHAPLIDNVFKDPLDEELSTFSIDVDTASYSLLRRSLMSDQCWPHRDQVRIEELINYFDYDYPAPDLEEVEAGQVAPFAVSIDEGAAPWAPKHRLVRIGLKSAELKGERPAANLVFLVDVSGSMSSPDKLELVQKSLRQLVPQLGAEDRVTLVAYAGRAGEVLAPTAGDDHETIRAAIDALSAGGSTNGAGGIKVAYQRAREHFVEDGVNRVILATDGDFNVGVSGDDELVQLVETQAKSGVFLTVLGFGSGNLNDAMMEKITNKGNGNYFYIDRFEEGKKVLVEQMVGTLVTVAKDVKIQVDFNPAKVASYRLIGYANRMLNREDFDNDKVDAGEIGADHTVTALYEVVPVGVAQELTAAQQVEGLKYQRRLDAAAEQDLEAKRQQQLADRGVEMVDSDDLLTVKLRYKRPTQNESALLEFPLADRAGGEDENVSDDFRFASAVAAFGMRLRESSYLDKQFSLEAIAELAAAAKGEDPSGRRAEFVEIVKRAAAVEPGAKEDVGRAVQERLEQLR